MAGAYNEGESMVEERAVLEDSVEFLQDRGAGFAYAPPDYTFAPGQYAGGTFTAATVTATATGGTVLSTTT
jgi:hypothetical protein